MAGLSTSTLSILLEILDCSQALVCLGPALEISFRRPIPECIELPAPEVTALLRTAARQAARRQGLPCIEINIEFISDAAFGGFLRFDCQEPACEMGKADVIAPDESRRQGDSEKAAECADVSELQHRAQAIRGRAGVIRSDLGAIAGVRLEIPTGVDSDYGMIDDPLLALASARLARVAAGHEDRRPPCKRPMAPP